VAQPTDSPPAGEKVASQPPAPREGALASSAPPAPAGEPAAGGQTDGKVRASPMARHIAAEHGLDLAGISGSGPQGRVIRADVEAAMAAPQPAASAEKATTADAEKASAADAEKAPAAGAEKAPAA